MAAKTLDFVFDFASLNAYLAYRALPGLIERTGATVNIVPCLLGGIFKATGNQAPFSAYAGIKGKIDYEARSARQARAYEVLEPLITRAMALQDAPEMGPLYRPYGEGVRGLTLKPYLILYRVTEVDILIERVVHGARLPKSVK